MRFSVGEDEADGSSHFRSVGTSERRIDSEIRLLSHSHSFGLHLSD